MQYLYLLAQNNQKWNSTSSEEILDQDDFDGNDNGNENNENDDNNDHCKGRSATPPLVLVFPPKKFSFFGIFVWKFFFCVR